MIARVLVLASIVLGACALTACGEGAPPMPTATPAPSTRPEGARLIDVGGYRLEIRCEGQGAPTIVFENGALPLVDVFTEFKNQAAREWRVCSYDRAGTGKSEAGPTPRDATTIAAELDRLLQAADEQGPFVFVTWSAGAQYTLAYAHAYPDHVGGLVFVDPRLPAYELDVPSPLDNPEKAALVEKLPPAYGQEFAAWKDDARRVIEAGSLPDVPIAVLTATSPEAVQAFIPPADDHALWVRTHEELASSVPRGRHVVVEDAEHRIWERNPGAVLEAIRAVIARG